jgi:DNA-binding transcriptional MerR regulator
MTPTGGTMSLEVGSVARIAGVTVRTLHHYDQIGLLRPSDRTEAGYRLYDDADLERLQRVLFYRELGFGLDQIKEMLDERGSSALGHLRRQHELLTERIGRLERMAVAVEKTMEAYKMGISLTPEERFEVFGDFDPEENAAEAQERWGETDAYRESQRRAAAYTKADWARHQASWKAVVDRVARAQQAGTAADAAEPMDAAEAHRALIDTWFYPCPPKMHVGLAEMYIADPRFTRTFEKVSPGLAQYLHDAILANAARAKS